MKMKPLWDHSKRSHCMFIPMTNIQWFSLLVLLLLGWVWPYSGSTAVFLQLRFNCFFLLPAFSSFYFHSTPPNHCFSYQAKASKSKILQCLRCLSTQVIKARHCSVHLSKLQQRLQLHLDYMNLQNIPQYSDVWGSSCILLSTKILHLRLDTSPSGNYLKTNTFMWKVSAPMNWHFSDENLAPNLWTISMCSLVVLRQPLPEALDFNCVHFHQTLMPLVGLCYCWNVAKTFTVYFCSLISSEIISSLYVFFFLLVLMYFDI